MTRAGDYQGQPPYRLTNITHQMRLLHRQFEDDTARFRMQLIKNGADPLTLIDRYPYDLGMAVRRMERRVARHRGDTSKHRRPHQGYRECERRRRRLDGEFNVLTHPDFRR